MKKIATIFLLTLILFVGFSSVASAQIWDGVTCNESPANPDNFKPCDWCDALKVMSNIIDFILEIAFGLAALFIAVGAIMMMISGGNEKRFSDGKSYLTNAIIGLTIALTAWMLINTILNIIAPDYAANGLMPWNEISCE